MIDYKPDRTFSKDLKRLDPRLATKFNGQHFVITFDRGHGQPVNILVVKGEDGAFRQPDNRDITKLKECDLAREDYRDKFMRVSQHYEQVREKMKKASHETFRDLTKDSKIQLQQAFGRLSSKANSAFRRVKLKPKGKVFREG